jgi:DnaK suppressor protein
MAVLRAKLQEQRELRMQQLGDIEIALNRMRTGRYGSCLYCGAEIPLERLTAVPEADACPRCATT